MSDRPQSNSKLLTPDSSLISQKPTCYQPVITASCDPTAEEVTETSNETKMNRETVKERIAEVRMSDPESLRRTLRSAPRSAQDTRGVIFRREYRGRIYEMRSLGNGRYEYDQKIYTSANAIAASPHRNGGGLTLKSPPYMLIR